jgi:hypothetical protein
MTEGKNISVGGSFIGHASIGDKNKMGDVVGNAPGHDVLRTDLRAAVDFVRAEVAKKDDSPEKVLALEELKDLDEQMASAEPDEGVTKHLLGKLAKRLTGALAVSISFTALAEKISGLFG